MTLLAAKPSSMVWLDEGEAKIMKVLAAFAAVFVSGCAVQLTEGTDQIRSVIADIFTRQALANLSQSYGNRYGVPSQIGLDKGFTTVSNSINTGVAPNIALRAIAITGISLTSGNTLQQNWATTPVTSFDDISRLQALYDFAVRGGRFAGLDRKFDEIGKLAQPISKTIGYLPDGPLVWVNRREQCQANPTTTSYGGNLICFRADLARAVPGSEPEPLTAENLQALFTLWTMATPQAETAAAAQAGGPATGAPAPSRRARARSQVPALFVPPSIVTQ